MSSEDETTPVPAALLGFPSARKQIFGPLPPVEDVVLVEPTKVETEEKRVPTATQLWAFASFELPSADAEEKTEPPTPPTRRTTRKKSGN